MQRRAARWARGAKGIISVTALLKDLDWLPLADRRRHQRLPFTIRLLTASSKSRTRQSNSLTLVRESGRDRHSPYWNGTILRSIPEWNRLSDWLQLTRLPPSSVGWPLHHSALFLVRALTLPGRPVSVCHWSTCGLLIKTRQVCKLIVFISLTSSALQLCRTY